MTARHPPPDGGARTSFVRATGSQTAVCRRDALWLAAIIHRLSGVALAVFLPFHFLFLGLALQGEGRLQTGVIWTANPLVKFAEMGLVFLLTLHLLGGLRVLVIENLAWHSKQKTAATLAVLGAASVALFYLAQIV